jgi:hypothetical protein
LKAAILQEQARVLAQGVHTDTETAAISEQQHACLEYLEIAHHEGHVDWKATLENSRQALLEMIRSKSKDAISLACREHVRNISELWDLMSEADREAHEQWHTENIRHPGLDTKLIDILASVEVQKILLKCSGCPICQEAGTAFNSSRPKVFQEHCKRKHNADFVLTTEPMVFTLSKILNRDIILSVRSETEKFIRMPVPICYHPRCSYHAPSGQSGRFHMEMEHKADPVPDLGI